MKKPLFSFVLVFTAILLTAMITRWTVMASAEAKGRFDAGLLSLKLNFLKNNSLLRPINDSQGRADLQKYLNEANTLMAWFYKEPAAEFWKSYPKENDPESTIKEMRKLAEEEGSKKRTAQSNLPIREECYKIVRAIYDEFKSSKYTTVASDFKGSVRVDVHTIKNEGNKLRWEVVVWGGIGPIVYNGFILKWFKAPTAEDKAEYEKALAQAKKRKQPPLPGEEMKDPATLHFAQSQSQSARPVVLPDFEGAEYINDFPPGAVINYFHTPSCPPDAEKMEMEFKLKSRGKSGEDQEMSFVFNIPVEGSWKGSWDGVQKIEAAPMY